jgi:hypothetical protein
VAFAEWLLTKKMIRSFFAYMLIQTIVRIFVDSVNHVLIERKKHDMKYRKIDHYMNTFNHVHYRTVRRFDITYNYFIYVLLVVILWTTGNEGTSVAWNRITD